ncbi:molybdenum cofactor biosynthesis protein MoaE [uncultured Pseudokineococcus sp.]|uniref:molybdenum cofactor biosynthesis protein MoaE n=1 Tax=uncultured Pseudokineococcus sp. TaxID=1642928 RepID=UPI002607583A|nr:molybdenum cofactor biosynthesis protein MoaE [uncultured Pseudokineococcus sp.]
MSTPETPAAGSVASTADAHAAADVAADVAGPPVGDPRAAGGARAPRDSSRVAPPARRLARAVVTEDVLSVAEHADAVEDPAAGAVVTFGGVVRDHDHGARVARLEYSAHPSAGRVVEEVAREVLAAHPVDALAVSHRTGALEVGDVAFAVAVAAAHRREAFAACEEVVEEVKARLPVWKRQVLADGGAEWVGMP